MGSEMCIRDRYNSHYATLPSLAPVVQTLDSAIHWINHYPLDNSIGFARVYPLDSDLSGGQRYPSFEQQLGPGLCQITNASLKKKIETVKCQLLSFFNI